MEGRAEENAPDVRDERNAQSKSRSEEKCPLCYQRKEILKPTLPPFSR